MSLTHLIANVYPGTEAAARTLGSAGLPTQVIEESYKYPVLNKLLPLLEGEGTSVGGIYRKSLPNENAERTIPTLWRDALAFLEAKACDSLQNVARSIYGRYEEYREGVVHTIGDVYIHRAYIGHVYIPFYTVLSKEDEFEIIIDYSIDVRHTECVLRILPPF